MVMGMEMIGFGAHRECSSIEGAPHFATPGWERMLCTAGYLDNGTEALVWTLRWASPRSENRVLTDGLR